MSVPTPGGSTASATGQGRGSPDTPALSPAPPRPHADAGTTIPLAALRMRLDQAPDAHWSLGPDGLPGRVLVQPAGHTITFPLGLDVPATLAGRVMLLPHDWRDGTGSVTASIVITDSRGRRCELWSRELAAASEQEPADGHELASRLPADTVVLELRVERRLAGRDRSIGRVGWVEPALTDAGLVPVRPPVPPTRPGSISHSGECVISVLTPVHDPPLAFLEQAIASVKAQSYPHWELCLVDDGSRDAGVVAMLEREAAGDPRIRLDRHDRPRGISAASNRALGLATGDYIALLDHDDVLAPDALERVAAELRADPIPDLLYSDEDVFADGRTLAVHLKPDWSPDNFRTSMYTCHLTACRRGLVVELGGFRSQYDGTQDYDLALRVIERTDRIAHIPAVLYRWRAHAGSSASDIPTGLEPQAKPFAYPLQSRALSEHLTRTGVAAQVQPGAFLGAHRIVHRVDPSVTAALLVAVDERWGVEDLVRAAQSWLSQSHQAWTVVLAGTPAALAAHVERLEDAGLERNRIVTTPTDSAANLAEALNAAARASEADHLILTESPVVGLTSDWLRLLLGYSAQQGIGASGPVVLSDDGRISDGGVAFSRGVPLFLLHGFDGSAAMSTATNVSALSGVLATRREVFERLGGLSGELGELALIDFCLRVRREGLRAVVVPDARLRLTVDATTNDLAALRRLRIAWGETLACDPYYSPGYRGDRGDFSSCRQLDP